MAGSDDLTEPGSTATDRPRQPTLAEGELVGRYRIGAVLGRGAMGIVYAAVDEELHRPVAVKLLHDRSDDAVLSEARAIAQLRHPSVIEVFDVGQSEHGAYIVMELFDGENLRQWAVGRPRHELLGALEAAGQGLAAAHAAGLVHGDFKPGNVLVRRDEVRVVDFGLAIGVDRTVVTGVTAQFEAARGTPAYMAPELHNGAPPSPASDQFAFCVTAWELLTGQRPFAAAHPLSEIANVLRGELDSLAMLRTGRIFAVLRRGLALEPARRFPGMKALLVALRRRGRGRIALVAALAGIALIAWAWPPTGSACDDEAKLAENLWADRRDAVEATLRRNDGRYADAAWRQLDAHVSDYAARWGAMRAATCPALDSDPVVACLASRAAALEVVTERLERASFSPAQAAELALTLEDPGACARADVGHDPELHARAASIRDELARAGMLAPADALPPTQAALAEAVALGDRRLEAEARGRTGRLLVKLGRIGDAIPELERAFFLAVEVDHARAAFSAADDLTFAHEDRGDAVAAGEWLRHLQSSLPREASPDDRAVLHMRAARVRRMQGRDEEVEAELDAAVAELDDEDGLTRLRLVGALFARSDHYAAVGRFPEARADVERARGIAHDVHGLDDGDLASYENVLGNLASGQGDFAAALDHYRAAREAYRREVGDQHPDIAGLTNNVAYALEGLRRLDEALVEYDGALARWIAVYGERHPEVAGVLVNQGNVHLRRGDLDAAEAAYSRAAVAVEASMGRTHPLHARASLGWAQVARRRGRYDEALRMCREVRDALAAEAELDIELQVLAVFETAEALAGAGRVEEARAEYEAASAIIEGKGMVQASTEIEAGLAALDD